MFDIVHELSIAASPQNVFDAVTTKEGVAGWFTSDCELSPEAGTQATFAFEDHSVVFTMTIDLIEAPELVHWECTGGPAEWPGTKIAFRIEADTTEPLEGDEPGRSVVRFWHGNWEYEDGVLPRVSFQWAMYLDSLRSYAETGSGSPAS